MTPPLAIVLPHREGFGPGPGPGTAGAVATVARLHAAMAAGEVHVLGRRFPGEAFPGIDFIPVDPPRALPLSHTQAYTLALIPALRRLPPGPIEVHNKPDVALWLSRAFPHRPVRLFLHNDPRTMRGARSPAARAKLLARLAGIATVSDHLRTCFLDGVDRPARPPVTIHNALDPATLPPPLPAAEREPTLLFAGRVVADKAPDAFVAACALALPALPGWRAHIIGADGFTPDGPETPYIRSLRPKAQAANVAMLGHRPRADVLAAMSRAAIVVIPSRWQEPFGLTALEAMMCGAAIACSNRGGLAEITGDTATLFDPDDPDAAAAALVRLAADSVAAAARSSARALAHFSVEAIRPALERFREQGQGRRP